MIEQAWKKVQDYFLTTLPQETFELWLLPAKAKTFESGLLTVEVPNLFHASWLEKNIKRKALELLKPAGLDVIDIEFHWDEALAKQARFERLIKTEPAHVALPTRKFSQEAATLFNPKYTFDRFVIGPTNRFAHASSSAVAQNPGKQFNPLFIYGNPGLGKTHLLHAIGSAMLKSNPNLLVLYINSEKFINEFIDSIKNRAMEAFRNRYRSADCLLIDDIQFLVGKEQSEQEFFFTFNSLFETNRQIVLTSDRPPKDLQAAEARLVSRFEWGVVADVKAPDFETRLAILRKKAESEGFSITDEILQQIAQNIKSNIRALEGCLNSLIAYSCLTGSPINLEATNQILKQLKEESSREAGVSPNIGRIQEVVAKNYNMDPVDLKDKSRLASKVLPRQVAIYLARTLTHRSLEEIGGAFGGKDHSTVIYAVSKITTLIRTDPFFSSFVNKLEKEINNSIDG